MGEIWNARGKELPVAHALRGRVGGVRSTHIRRSWEVKAASFQSADFPERNGRFKIWCAIVECDSRIDSASSSKILASDLSLNLAS
jgi:hypothetical protein